MRSRTPYRISPWLSSKRTKSVTSTYVPSSARNRGSGCGCIAVSLCLCGLATACVSANRAATLPKKAGRQSVSIALSQRSARSKKRHMYRGSLPTWEEGHGSLCRFTGQGTSLGAQKHAAVVDAHAFRLPQYDIGYARVRGTVVQGVHC